jgi:tryptophanyl-tRNA synthetase
MDLPANKTILSAVQPSGVLHIGNYLGALKQWVELQRDNTAYYCIVDEHAITVPYEPAELPSRVLDTTALYVAAGIDPTKSIIFVQSQVPAHTELSWILATITPFGELNRMTQFKDKSKKQAENTSAALFTYPVLMTADILLYQADLVPVGEDQLQHLEFARELARRFNSRFGDVFTVPAPFINKQSARIMSLTDPEKKMSKSDAPSSYIALTDAPDIIRKKIKSAVTETEPVFSFENSGPAVKNLLNIYAAFSGEETATIEQKFSGKGYKEFKEALAEVIIEKLTPLQTTFATLRQDEKKLKEILNRGREQANQVANKTLSAVKEKMGLL